jgi:hypothetical protein
MQKPEWQLTLPKHSRYYMYHLLQHWKIVYFIKLFIGFILSRVGVCAVTDINEQSECKNMAVYCF